MQETKLINKALLGKESALSKLGMLFGGNNDGFEVVDGLHPNAVESFSVLSVKGEPRLFLPTDFPIMRTAVDSFLGARAAFVLPAVMKTFSPIGGPVSKFFSFASVVSTTGEDSPLRLFIANVLGRDDFKIALRVSFGRPNAKTVAMAISNSGEALCFVKIGSEAMTTDLIAHEGAMLKQFEGQDMPIILPTVLYSGTWVGDRSVLITKPLTLQPLKRNADSAHMAVEQLSSMEIAERTELANSAYWLNIMNTIEAFEDGKNLLNTASYIEKKWGQIPFDFGIGHGDWTRANLGLVDGKLAAIDWERCSNNAPKGLDIAYFAIADNKNGPAARSIDINKVAKTLAGYLDTANIPEHHAQPLIMFASLEMVIRFKSAVNVGLPSIDSKFGRALREGVQSWAQD